MGLLGNIKKQFKSTLVEHITHVFNAVASSASFPQKMLKAFIITLLKPGKEPTFSQNFRPIYLLNHDVKLYAKVVANRLINLLPSLIHPNQSGFTKGRQTSNAILLCNYVCMINIIYHTNNHKVPSLLLYLDAEKAFDRVHWHYLTMTLQKCGYHGHILSAIMALYSHPSGQVYCSTMLSTPFNISNGIRQGCPLSPLLFNLVMEPLSLRLQHCFIL